MADQGAALGVDLNELYVVAHYLTKVSGDYVSARKLVESCTPPGVYPPWTGIVPEWMTLRNSISDILADTARNLTDTATVLNQNANDYAATDQAAAAEFDRLKQVDPQQQKGGW